MLKKMWTKGNKSPYYMLLVIYLLLGGVQRCLATVEIHVAVPQKTGNLPQDPAVSLGHIPKEYAILPQGLFLNYIHSNFIHSS